MGEDFLKIFESVGGQGGDVTGLQAELERLASLAGASPDNKADDGDIASSLAATIAQMTANTAELGKEPSEEELQSMFSSLGIADGGVPGTAGLQDGLTNLMPMMEGMMQSLLSKDLLYPAMKEMKVRRSTQRIINNASSPAGFASSLRRKTLKRTPRQ